MQLRCRRAGARASISAGVCLVCSSSWCAATVQTAESQAEGVSLHKAGLRRIQSPPKKAYTLVLTVSELQIAEELLILAMGA